VKVLYWDGTGLWVMIKRLEQGTFSWPKGVEVEHGKLSLRPEALALLLDGVDMRSGSFRPWYQR
jgi:transposase